MIYKMDNLGFILLQGQGLMRRHAEKGEKKIEK
jgi:hypothetical protein